MAGNPCVLKLANTSSTIRESEETLYKQFELNSKFEIDAELVTPRDINTSNNMLESRGAEVLLPTNYDLSYARKPSLSIYYDSIENARQEKMLTFHDGLHDGIHHNRRHSKSPTEQRSPPRLERITDHYETNRARRSISPKRRLPYNYSKSSPETGKLYPDPISNGMIKSSYIGSYNDQVRQARYDDYDHASSHYPAKCSEGYPCAASDRDSIKDTKPRTHTKPRFKYTPLRNDIPYHDEAQYGYQGRYLEDSNHSKDLHNTSPRERRYNNGHRSATPPCRLPCCSSQNYPEKHPYYRPYYEGEKSPLSRSFLCNNLYYERSKLGEEYPHQRRFGEAGERASAFSVIRPSSLRRMYSTESGYSSDPSNAKILKPLRPHEKTDLYSRHRIHSYSGSESSTRAHLTYRDLDKQTYRDQEKHEHKEHDGQLAGSKLHVYDEASKAALRAFDAHVEKMMAESRGKQSRAEYCDTRDMTVNGDHQMQDTINVQETTQLKNELRSSSSSSPPSLVQVSTVDSTQPTDAATYGVGGLLGLTMVANEHLGQAIAKEKKRSKNNNCLHLWQFLRSMLDQEKDKPNKCIEWTNRERGEFRLIKTAVIADLWGQSKNRTCMTYEKMARAMRYYYKMKILEKVPHKRLHFRFGEKMLAKVLDSSTLKPLRHTSPLDKDIRCNQNPSKVHTLTDENLNAYRNLLNEGKSYLNGNCHSMLPMQSPDEFRTSNIKSPSMLSFQSRTNQSRGIPTPTTVAHVLITHHRSSTDLINNSTPVICSSSGANIFFPQEVPVLRSNEMQRHAETTEFSSDNMKNDPNLIGQNSKSSDSDTGIASTYSTYSGDDTPVSSPQSDSEGELVVDTEDD